MGTIVFRSFRMNNEGGGALNPLSDTLPGSGENGCAFDRFGGFTYDLVSGSYNRMRIWNNDNGWDGPNKFGGIVTEFFDVPNKESQTFWKMFRTHNVPSQFPDSVTEEGGYDLVIIKNPYACWAYMTQQQADSIKEIYKTLRDSIVAHPEINVGLAFGTPLRLGTQVFDSSQAKITYNLLQWFMSDSFFVHSNTGTYKNIWKVDTYSPFLEMRDQANKYCLADNMYPPGEPDSHPSPQLGATTGQTALISFIRTAVHDILVQRSGLVTRADIDQAIYDFQHGNATEQEVLDLIRQYNTGQ